MSNLHKPVIYAEVVTWDRTRVRVKQSTAAGDVPHAWLLVGPQAAGLSVDQVRVIRDGLTGWLRDYGGETPPV